MLQATQLDPTYVKAWARLAAARTASTTDLAATQRKAI